mgnify:CR=1 FL=1
MVILFVLLTFLPSSACFWSNEEGETPGSEGDGATISAENTEETTAVAADEGSHFESKLSDIFSLENKIDEIRYLYEHGRESYAVNQARGVLPQLKPNSRKKLELHFLMARCFERLGRDKERKRHDSAFRKILEHLGKSKEHRRAIEEGQEIRELIEKSIEMSKPSRSRHSPREEEIMFNVRCARRLQRVSAEEVIHENMPSGEIYYGRSAKEVRQKVASAMNGLEDEVVLQRDPRFGFYFCIIEAKL